jgi:hypothetical protein
MRRVPRQETAAATRAKHDSARRGIAPKHRARTVAADRHRGGATMGTAATAAPGGGAANRSPRAALSGRARAAKAARALWVWLTDTGYRPERRYMRGGRPDDASAPQPSPA